jgi:glycosyltransferase involved in cell wall biosynthesis
MLCAIKGVLGDQANVSIQPFISRIIDLHTASGKVSSTHYDFVYVSSGEIHKNHANLLLAWHLLAKSGLNPSLALTVDTFVFPKLGKEIEKFQACTGVNIINLGNIDRVNLPAIYKSCSAMIFPSKLESFGLPLIEASHYGLPILASELDYVRDVIEPVETFDPDSPISIARAVKRFLGKVDSPILVGSAKEFLYEVLK